MWSLENWINTVVWDDNRETGGASDGMTTLNFALSFSTFFWYLSSSSRVSMTTWFLWFCHAKFDNICGDFLFLCANDNFTKKKCHYDVLCPSKLHCLFLFEYSHLLFFKVQFFELCHENFELTRIRFKKGNGGPITNKLTWNDWRIGVFLKTHG